MKCSGDGVNPCPECISAGRAENCCYPPKGKCGPKRGWIREQRQLYEEVCAELEVERAKKKPREEATLRTELADTQGRLAEANAYIRKLEHALQALQRKKDGDGTTFWDDESSLPTSQALPLLAEFCTTVNDRSHSASKRRRRASCLEIPRDDVRQHRACIRARDVRAS